MNTPQPNAPLPALRGGLKVRREVTEAAFEQLRKAIGDSLLGKAIDLEKLDELVDRCECAYVDEITDADEAIRALLHVHHPLPDIEEPSDLKAFDQAVDLLATTEASTATASGVLDAPNASPHQTTQLDHHAQAVSAFDAAVEAYAHAEESIQTLIGLFENAFEKRFASRPADLEWGRAIFANLHQRLGGDGGLLDRSDDLVAAAADALDAFGANWCDERGIDAAAIAQGGNSIVCAVCNAMAQQRRHSPPKA